MDWVESSPRPDPVDDGRLDSSDEPGPPEVDAGPGADADGPGPTAHDGAAPVPADDAGGLDGGRDPLRFSNWMKRSATGAVMTGIAVGLKEALQPQRKEVPFVIESRDDPDDQDKPIDLHFDPDSPEATVAIIRRPVAGPPDPPPPPT